MQQTDLLKPFRANLIEKKPGAYEAEYVAHGHYVEKLIANLGGFDFHIIDRLYGKVRDKNGGESETVLVGCLARLDCTIDGIPRSITEVGDCEHPLNLAHDGARLKFAASDAIKRCSARLGLGLHLYCGSEYRVYDALLNREAAAATGVTPITATIQGTPAASKAAHPTARNVPQETHPNNGTNDTPNRPDPADLIDTDHP